MLIFFAIVSIVFGALGYYLYNRISGTFTGTFLASKPFLAIYIFVLASFFLGKILENYSINMLSETLVRIGSYGLGFFVYAILVFLFFDILRLINFILPFYPSFIKENIQDVKRITGIIFASGVVLLVGYGIWNAFTPKVKNLNLTIEKKVEGLSELNVVAISDTHLGTMVNKTKAKRLIKEINKLNPDLVIIAGDIIDDNIKAVKKYKLLEYFNELKPKFGIHGIMGNHEYIGRSFTDLEYYEENNINMHIDTAELIDDKFYIVGRDDIQAKSFFNRDRKDLNALIDNIDKNKPIILMDHQPYNLEMSQAAGVDLHFSGHTHHGQFWPFNLITGRIFENDWGYLKKGDTHYYVSCGYGTAGPPIRIGSHPEIVNMKISFKEMMPVN